MAVVDPSLLRRSRYLSIGVELGCPQAHEHLTRESESNPRMNSSKWYPRILFFFEKPDLLWLRGGEFPSWPGSVCIG